MSNGTIREQAYLWAIGVAKRDLVDAIRRIADAANVGDATVEDREKFVAYALQWQKASCSFCSFPIQLVHAHPSWRPVVDHDRRSSAAPGFVRGIAHSRCNRSERQPPQEPLRRFRVQYSGLPHRFTALSRQPRQDAEIVGTVLAEVADERMSRVGIHRGDIIPVSWISPEKAKVYYRSGDGSLRWTPVQWQRFVHEQPLTIHFLRDSTTDPNDTTDIAHTQTSKSAHHPALVSVGGEGIITTEPTAGDPSPPAHYLLDNSGELLLLGKFTP